MFMTAKKAKEKELMEYGLTVGDIKSGEKKHRLLILLSRALLIFLALFGTIVGFGEAFSLPYNKAFVIISFAILSLAVSFIYCNKITFYIGYAFLFIGFMICLVRYYIYANSGFQAIINVVYEKYSDYFKLISLRQSEELNTNRYLTITVAFVFAAFVLAILLNITISGYMNLWETMLITFPFLEIPLYIGVRPPVLTLSALLCVYIAVGIMQADGDSRMPVKPFRAKEFKKYKIKKKRMFFHQGDWKVSFISIVFSLIISLVICIFSTGIYNSESKASPTSNIKKSTDDIIKTYVQVGWTGWLNRYSATGGISNGQLGGISSIRPDFETDLTVTYAPSNYSTVYLAGFRGTYYNASNWFENSYEPTESGQNDLLLLQEEIDEFDKAASASSVANSVSSGKMWVENLGANNNYFYLPYRSSKEDVSEVVNGKEASSPAYVPNEPINNEIGKTYSIDYSPILYEKDYVLTEDKTLKENEEYEYYVMNSCTSVPEDLDDYLDEYCRNNDNFGLKNPEDYRDVNEYRLEAMDAVYYNFFTNYSYTMSPGTTPYSDDFVRFFLETQQRGYCCHFASSGVMLLRHLGVPARYVEGYCIPLSLVDENGTGLDVDFDEWYQGESFVNEKGVLTVDVNDSYAHAWIEVYMEGYGFIPFEMTPPSYEEESSPSVFSNLFSNLMIFDLDSGDISNSAENNSDLDIENRFNFSFLTGSFSGFYTSLATIIVLAVLIILAVIFGRKIHYTLLIKKLKKKNAYPQLVYIKYDAIVTLLKRKGLVTGKNPLPEEVSQILTKVTIFKEQFPDLENHFTYIEKVLYSPEPGTKEEYETFEKWANSLLSAIRKAK